MKVEIQEEPQVEEDSEPWPERFTSNLQPFLSEAVIAMVRELYLEGPEPPFISDGGWSGRKAKVPNPETGEGESTVQPPAEVSEPAREETSRRGRDRGSRGGRGGRGGRAGRLGEREDHRRVVSDVCNISRGDGNTIILTDRFSLSHPRRLVQACIRQSDSCSAASWILRPILLRQRQTKVLASSSSGQNAAGVIVEDAEVALKEVFVFLSND